ncbi:MAG TPA: tetratricopeptide repeat protein [Terriglobales bacterium]|nr:tetratricopeptide repeat protein [Terriglobales bacterium]
MPANRPTGGGKSLVLLLTSLAVGWSPPLGASLGSPSARQTIRHHTLVEQDPSFPPELTQAEAAIDKKDYPAAVALLRKVVEEHPNNYQAWFDLGFVENALGHTQESIAAYRKSVTAKPDVFESNLNLGLMLAKTGQPDAEEFLRAATKLTPTGDRAQGQARAWISLGHILEHSKPEEATQAYLEAAALTPKDPEAHLSAGLLLDEQNRFLDAEQQYKQVLAVDPQSSDALTGLANLYLRGHRLADAEQVLEELLRLRPNDPAVHLELGRVLAAAGNKQEAIRELESATKLVPADPDLERQLADLYSASQRYDQAEAEYRRLVAERPQDAESHHGLGVVLMKQKKFAAAEQELLMAVKLKPDSGAAYGDLAVAANENKNYALAIRAADARAKYLPEIPVSYFLRATAYDHLRAYKQAAENYHKFLDVAHGEYPDQEWQARHRLIAIEPKK